AIRAVGLEPDLLKITDIEVLKSTIYAYLRGKVPLILVVYLLDMAKPQRPIGRHAVTVAGYRFGVGTRGSVTPGKLPFTSSAMERFYAHDDQIGPFARMVFDAKPVTTTVAGKQRKFPLTLSTSWYDGQGARGNIRALPDVVIAPIY